MSVLHRLTLYGNRIYPTLLNCSRFLIAVPDALDEYDGPYDFFIPAGDHRPAHVHVERDDDEAIFTLSPVTLRDEDNYGFNRSELTDILEIIIENRSSILETWKRYGGPN